MYKCLALVVSLLVLSACATNDAPPYALVFEAGVSAEDRASMVAAANEWNSAVGVDVFYADAADMTAKPVCNTVRVVFENRDLTEVGEAIGSAQNMGCYWEVKIASRARLFPEAIAHELGHVLCLDHTDEPGSIMHTYPDQPISILPSDAANVRAYWNL